MKYRIATWFLLLCLFALSANRAEACSSGGDAKHTATFHEASSGEPCCTTGDVQSGCCPADAEHQPGETSCPCDHEDGACHCPGCQILIHSGAAFTLDAPAFAPHQPDFLVQKQPFYFADHLPEAVYLPIWQPPKIAVSRNAVPAIS